MASSKGDLRTNNLQSLSVVLTFWLGSPCGGRFARLQFKCGCKWTGVGGRAGCRQYQVSSSTVIRNRDPLKVLGCGTSIASLLGLYQTAMAMAMYSRICHATPAVTAEKALRWSYAHAKLKPLGTLAGSRRLNAGIPSGSILEP